MRWIYRQEWFRALESASVAVHHGLQKPGGTVRRAHHIEYLEVEIVHDKGSIGWCRNEHASSKAQKRGAAQTRQSSTLRPPRAKRNVERALYKPSSSFISSLAGKARQGEASNTRAERRGLQLIQDNPQTSGKSGWITASFQARAPQTLTPVRLENAAGQHTQQRHAPRTPTCLAPLGAQALRRGQHPGHRQRERLPAEQLHVWDGVHRCQVAAPLDEEGGGLGGLRRRGGHEAPVLERRGERSGLRKMSGNRVEQTSVKTESKNMKKQA